ncbi:MAG: SUMF1/EgtB/PvdO family nonheme iron enzyme [Planctomycetota bacterium]
MSPESGRGFSLDLQSGAADNGGIMYRVLRPLALVWLAANSFAAETPAPAFPLWDGQESVEQYAKRTNLPPTKTLDLGNGVNLELVLIPAGKFVMGSPYPKPVDEVAFRRKITVGQAVLAAGCLILLFLLGGAILQAIRKKTRFQYSLRRFMGMAFAASLCVLGGMHWWYSGRALAQAQGELDWDYVISNLSETPAHEVTLTKPFYMGKFSVTQTQYQQVSGTNPSEFKGANLPVEQVSWNDAAEFCEKMSENTGQSVRLPTEAERECACRAGTTTTYNTGDSKADLDKAAWYWDNSNHTTHLVGQKLPNAWGVYDMHGNVKEWCQDWYKPYRPEPVADPQGPSEGESRVLRGGSSSGFARECRTAVRDWYSPVLPTSSLIGFRVVVEVPTKTP